MVIFKNQNKAEANLTTKLQNSKKIPLFPGLASAWL